MAIPTMIATLIMAPRVVKETKKYIKKLKFDKN
jgi:Na+/alanine symporter